MRLYDWESRLTAYITAVARDGFVYGRHDCALFAAGGVQAVLKGEGLLRVLDAAMEGGPGIELLGGDLDRRPMQVAAIRMTGRDTHVTLICCGAAPGVH